MNKVNTRKSSGNKWSTITGSFLPSYKAKGKVKIELPKLNITGYIFVPFDVTCQKRNYDVIFVKDLLWELGVSLDFQNNFVGWKETKIPIKPINYN